MGPYDILCGRQADAWNNEGNVKFRTIISEHVQKYMNATSNVGKTSIIKSIIHLVTKKLGGRFLKEYHQHTSGGYRELNRREVHNKVGHALRDLAKQINQRRQYSNNDDDDYDCEGKGNENELQEEETPQTTTTPTTATTTTTTNPNPFQERSTSSSSIGSSIDNNLCWGKKFFPLVGQ